jgi:isoleucyl-tRNA synthetase
VTTDYKATVFLPRTDFPMRGNLPEREPQMLARWADMNLFARLRESGKGREKFILHDGPPYANGAIHIGHALNKILKDVINRAQQMSGKDTFYIPGWDCHGLPIEWKIEEQYRAAGKNKDEVPIIEFRRECREFAEKWVDYQRTEFRRLGVEGDWDNPYTTMKFSAEAQIVREIGKFLLNGGLYRGQKPVLWSVVEKTALADAEVEYYDHTSNTIWVRFPVLRSGIEALDGASIVIWTTTPWTMPANRAIAFAEDGDYRVLRAKAGENAFVRDGELIVAAAPLVEALERDAGCSFETIASFKGADLAGTVTAHPLRGKGYEFDVPLLAADFVTMDQGTGFVHIAPGHGTDDFVLGMAHGLEVPPTVDAEGIYYDHVPLFAGRMVINQKGKKGDADKAVMAALEEAGALLAKGQLVHSYPHSWRSKAPLIFRNTAQWFISMETNDLREKALAAIDDTRFVPPQGKNRLRGMIESRPDWCISRQRAWGVPIAIFVEKKTGEPLRDANVVERIAQIFETEGADAWFSSDPARFLGNDYNPDDYEQIRDIVEVWFESGSTHAFVLEPRKDTDLQWPASLYLEGSDQHRGWFHSSLLEACGTRGRAPYDAVLTHGFVLDEQGRKMSKSLGNVVSPQDVMKTHGADILRLWVVASDYSDDLRIGPEIIKHHADAYRRFRNTFRYLLGALDGFSESERLPESEMPELERWILHRLEEIGRQVRHTAEAFDFHHLYTALHQFCAVDLSAFYFDVRKDALYCDAVTSVRRRAVRTVFDHLHRCLTTWLAPILCFTAEEAWLARPGAEAESASVHLRTFPVLPETWRDEALAAKWDRLRRLRRVVTGALELERAAKRIGSSLQAHPVLFAPADELAAAAGIDFAELAITSSIALKADPVPADAFTLPDVPNVGVVIGNAGGEKCARCWRVLPEVGHDAGHPETCDRCAEAVAELESA